MWWLRVAVGYGGWMAVGYGGDKARGPHQGGGGGGTSTMPSAIAVVWANCAAGTRAEGRAEGAEWRAEGAEGRACRA